VAANAALEKADQEAAEAEAAAQAQAESEADAEAAAQVVEEAQAALEEARAADDAAAIAIAEVRLDAAAEAARLAAVEADAAAMTAQKELQDAQLAQQAAQASLELKTIKMAEAESLYASLDQAPKGLEPNGEIDGITNQNSSNNTDTVVGLLEVNELGDINFYEADTENQSKGEDSSEGQAEPDTTTQTNTAPVAEDTRESTNEHTSLGGQMNATDIDGDTLTFMVITEPFGGTLEYNNDGTFYYNPNNDFTGVDFFDFDVSDGNGGSDTGTVEILVEDIAEVLIGTSSDDTIYGLGENDTIYGGDGNDTLYGDALDDSSLNGNDALYGEDGADYLVGGNGSDSLDGGDGDDILDAGAGNDIIYGSVGNDSINGGTGDSDLLTYNLLVDNGNNFNGIVYEMENGYLEGDDFYNNVLFTATVTGIEQVEGTVYNDVIWGDSNTNVIRGSYGDDYLKGDDPEGTHGGTDHLTYEYLSVEESFDGVTVDLWENQVTGINGEEPGTPLFTDSVYYFEIVTGSQYADTFYGTGDGTTLIGAGGADTLDGGLYGEDIFGFTDAESTDTINYFEVANNEGGYVIRDVLQFYEDELGWSSSSSKDMLYQSGAAAVNPTEYNVVVVGGDQASSDWSNLLDVLNGDGEFHNGVIDASAGDGTNDGTYIILNNGSGTNYGDSDARVYYYDGDINGDGAVNELELTLVAELTDTSLSELNDMTSDNIELV